MASVRIAKEVLVLTPSDLQGHVVLSLAEYSLRLRFSSAGRMSHHLGTTLRGGLGKALRDAFCVEPHAQGAECLLAERCAYGYLFETPVSADAQVLRRYTKAPHPFVLRPPLDPPQTVSVHSAVEIGLAVFGRGNEYLPYLLIGLERLGAMGLGPERIPFSVDEVRGAPTGEVLYERGQRGPLRAATPAATRVDLGAPRDARFTIEFRTPLRLRVQERVVRGPDFTSLVSASLRRLELLCRSHEAGEFELDAASLARHARSVRLVEDETRWLDLSRYSARQEQSMPLGGIVGHATFEGDAGTFSELLSLAGRAHVGKSTAFGHGHFTVEEEEAGHGQ